MKMKLLIILLVFSGFANAQLPNYLWTRNAGGTGMDNGQCVARDAGGNTIVTGYFTSSSIMFGTITLTNPSNLGNADFFLVKYDANGNVLWARNAGGSPNDYGYSVATDASGNILVTGSFSSPTITFGATTLTNAAAGRNDIFIVKYDPNGTVLWAKRAGGSGWDEGLCVSTDAAGNVLLAGDFSSSLITFGTSTLSTTVANTWDIFLVKFDASGNVIWAKSEGGSGSDNVRSVSTDASGSVLITGFFTSPSISIATITLTNAGNGDFFLVKYDSGGNALWAKSTGGANFDKGNSIATDAGGNIITTGYFISSSMVFGTTTLTSGATSNFFLVKYDSGGNVIWAKKEGGNANAECFDVTTDASGNIIITGSFTSPSIAFGTTTLTNAGVSDIFIAKYDPAGNLLWARRAGGNTDDEGNSVSTDASGDIFVTGYSASPSITFGTTTLTNAGGLDFFLVKLSDAITTGVEETDFTSSIEVFPNPVSTQITLQTDNSLNNAAFKMLNAIGETVVKIENINGQTLTFDRGDLPCGTYIAYLTQGSKLLATKKIIIAD